MKALELIVYEIDQAEPSMVVVDGFWAYRPHDPAKRLTDAELAAEYWAAFADTNACADTPDDSFKKYAAIENTIHRFATLPHYDEPTP